MKKRRPAPAAGAGSARARARAELRLLQAAFGDKARPSLASSRRVGGLFGERGRPSEPVQAGKSTSSPTHGRILYHVRASTAARPSAGSPQGPLPPASGSRAAPHRRLCIRLRSSGSRLG